MRVIIALLSLLPIFLGGDLFLDLLSTRKVQRSGKERFTLAFILGGGITAYMLFLTSLLVHQLAMYVTIAIIFLLALVNFYYKRRVFQVGSGEQLTAVRERPFSLWWVVPLIFIGISVIAVSWVSDLGFDGLLTWGFKGKLAFGEGTWPVAYFVDPWRQLSHPDYPLLIPSIEAWIYTFLGLVDEQVVKLLFILCYFALLVLFWDLSEAHVSSSTSIFYTILLATTPYLASIAAVSGYVDVPLALYLLGATAYLHRWVKKGQDTDLLLGAVLSALAVWVKREGIVYWLFNAFTVVAYVLVWGHTALSWREKGNKLLRFFVPAALILLPWFGFLKWLQVPNSDFAPISITTLWENRARVPIIVGKVVGQYVSFGRWGVAWVIWWLVTLGRWRQFSQPATLYLWSVAFFPVMGLSFVFVFSVWEPFTLHMDLSLERLFLHALPLAWYFMTRQTPGLEVWFRQLLRGKRQAKKMPWEP